MTSQDMALVCLWYRLPLHSWWVRTTTHNTTQTQLKLIQNYVLKFSTLMGLLPIKASEWQ